MAVNQPFGDFGARLRHAREAKGVSLRSIADTTKISMVALEALERSDISHLPGGIFSRAFVRAFAAEVGLDPEATVDEFVRQFPHDPATDGHPSSARIGAGDPLARRRSLSSLGMKVVGIGAPIAALLAYLEMTGRGANRGGELRPIEPPTYGVAVSGRAGSAALLERLSVEVVAVRPCSVSVAIDGQAMMSLALEAAARRSFDAERELSLWVSDAGALEWQVDGMPGRPLGQTGEQATAHVTLDNYREFLGGR